MKNNGQLSLNLGGGSRSRTPPSLDQEPFNGLYFAILPDPEIAARSFELAGIFRRQYGFSTKPRRKDLFHITLYQMKIDPARELPEDVAFAAMEAASMIRRQSFQVSFDQAVSFGNTDNRPLVLWNKNGNMELKALHRELDEAVELTGFKRGREKQVEPHMTLLYRGHLIPDILLDEPVSWTARDFVLINSLYGKATHDHLCYWTLRD
ncbi:2'-5' RNA ligase family protein [Rhizobium freirei]|nr:2'-5' RNA ligase family protein [Rhizobium freirei]